MSTQPIWSTWTVTKFRTPREDSDPLGVFKIEEVARQAAVHDDESCEHEPNSPEEQAALDKRDAVTESACRLIAAAPELLYALRAILRWSGALPPSQSRDMPDFTEDKWTSLARAAIAKATSA